MPREIDIRALIAGLALVTAIPCATYLYAIDKVEGAIAMGGLASTALLFIVGLHSSPYTGDPTDPEA